MSKTENNRLPHQLQVLTFVKSRLISKRGRAMVSMKNNSLKLLLREGCTSGDKMQCLKQRRVCIKPWSHGLYSSQDVPITWIKVCFVQYFAKFHKPSVEAFCNLTDLKAVLFNFYLGKIKRPILDMRKMGRGLWGRKKATSFMRCVLELCSFACIKEYIIFGGKEWHFL